MDLGIVHDRLQQDLTKPWSQKWYLTAEEFANDVRLVFKNCFLYLAATPNHHVFQASKELCTRFEERFAEKMHEVERRGPRCPLAVRCQMLLTDLRRNPLTEWFRRAKDWRALGPDYLENISSKTPMDLDEVQSRLDGGRYRSDGGAFNAATFDADVQLVWRNALDFNRGEGTNFGVMAKLVQAAYDRRLKQTLALPRPIAEEIHSGGTSAAAEATERLRELRDACQSLPLTAASDMVDVVEEACPEAVKRRKTEARVDLDKVDPVVWGVLTERARKALRVEEGRSPVPG